MTPPSAATRPAQTTLHARSAHSAQGGPGASGAAEGRPDGPGPAPEGRGLCRALG